jgi:predicted Na+-dependent transporter
MTVIGLTLGSLATPFYVRALMGAALEVDIAAVMKQIAIIVFICSHRALMISTA